MVVVVVVAMPPLVGGTCHRDIQYSTAQYSTMQYRAVPHSTSSEFDPKRVELRHDSLLATESVFARRVVIAG